MTRGAGAGQEVAQTYNVAITGQVREEARWEQCLVPERLLEVDIIDDILALGVDAARLGLVFGHGVTAVLTYALGALLEAFVDLGVPPVAIALLLSNWRPLSWNLCVISWPMAKPMAPQIVGLGAVEDGEAIFVSRDKHSVQIIQVGPPAGAILVFGY